MDFMLPIIGFLGLLLALFLFLGMRDKKNQKLGKLKEQNKVNEQTLNDIKTVKENDQQLGKRSREELIKAGSKWDVANNDNKL